MKMKIVMTGATGLVGTALVTMLSAYDHKVYRLMRNGKELGGSQSRNIVDVPWDAEGQTGETAIAGDVQGDEPIAAVNLAGASIVEGRWTEERKALLRTSRIDTTRRLVENFARMKRRPSVLVSASAIGCYGNRGDEILTEDSELGADFLAKLAVEWEREALKAKELGMRVVLARFGIILAKNGGALPAMMKPFKLGLGGKLGTGKQWMSWVALEDVVQIVKSALEDDGISGAVNVVAPEPVRNEEFTEALARAMQKPAVLSAPAFALRLAMGERADALLLASQRVKPKRLQESGYRFRQAHVEEALREILKSRSD
jgi:uncharacterized protein (TIGR01777 family)